MGQYFDRFYFGKPFEQFGTPHVIALLIIACVNITIFIRRQHFTPRARTVLRLTLAGIQLVRQASRFVWLIYIGETSIQTMLPLHLCSLFSILSAVMLITRSYPIYEFAYFLGTGGAIYAMITPDMGLYGFPHFFFIKTMLSHGCLLTAQVQMTVVEKFRPYWRSIPRVIIGGNVYILLIGIINWLTGSNYLFIAHKPEAPTLLDNLGPWPWYILGIEAISITTGLLLYLPFAIIDRRRECQSAQETSEPKIG